MAETELFLEIDRLRAQLAAETARANAAEESLRQHVWECKNELTHRINADLKTAIVKAERAAFDSRTALTQVTRERDEALGDGARAEGRRAGIEEARKMAVRTGNTTDHCMACCYAVADSIRALADGGET